MTHSTWIYILLMILTTNIIRVIPITLIRKQIKNHFIQSFLYYVPYVTLAVMTFPAITEATSSPVAGYAALGLGIIAAWAGLGLFPVSVICCVAVFILEMLPI
ncbi:MAG: AzlD domain-containing protein [Lachnospiraceae bacterium]|nr:AzlD domain-containing protein [Lachnospiraceae bacterium]